MIEVSKQSNFTNNSNQKFFSVNWNNPYNIFPKNYNFLEKYI